jgi:hypothetical protein
VCQLRLSTISDDELGHPSVTVKLTVGGEEIRMISRFIQAALITLSLQTLVALSPAQKSETPTTQLPDNAQVIVALAKGWMR